MAKTNIKKKYAPVRTHGGAIAVRIGAEAELRRSVMSCLLFEKEFYEEGVEIAGRIAELVPHVDGRTVSGIALEARTRMNLRHIPLFLVAQMAKHASHAPFVAETLAGVIQRADELSEFLAIYSAGREGRKTLNKLSKQVQKGLARAFEKFNEYQLAKYNQDNAIKLRDVLFLSHAKPRNAAQAKLWKRLIDKKLATPDTWEVAISACKTENEKRVAWKRLIEDKKLGAMAYIRNLRNMELAGVDKKLIKDGFDAIDVKRVLPYRFITAAIHAPGFEEQLEKAMLRGLTQAPKLAGKTILVVDVSGSMYGGTISGHSEIDRAKIACSLGILIRELCEESAIYATAGNDGSRRHKTSIVPSRRGFALSDAIYGMTGPLGGGGIFLRQVMDYVKDQEKSADRIIVITDEQDCSGSEDSPSKADAFGKQNYLINVASARNGIGYGKWTHIDGFSDSVVSFIAEYEKSLGMKQKSR